jgi:UDP-3-O-[3-hydroxymyristoyl] glucosamine N-acyltransferase
VTTTLRQLADLVQGEVEGDGQLEIESACSLDEARPGFITFADESHLDQFHHSPASAAVVPHHASANGKPIIRAHDPLAAFATIYQVLRPVRPSGFGGIHPSAAIDPSAMIGTGASIGSSLWAPKPSSGTAADCTVAQSSARVAGLVTMSSFFRTRFCMKSRSWAIP